MGAGASMDPSLGFLDGSGGDGERYYCHSCHRVFGLGSVQNPQDYYCPHCHSTFLEEIGGSDQIAVRHRNHGPLTTDQSRRITSATAMLRLLEAQLREELETLQLAFTAASASMNEEVAARNKQRHLTKLMKSFLRNTTVTLDMACSQPSCPICSEDFVLTNDVLRMPCSHIFHDSCVMPWLEMKQNCPICRAELCNSLPTVSELEPCSIIDLKTRLREFDVDEEVLQKKDKPELIQLLLEKYKELQEAEAKVAAEDASETANNSSTMSFPLILRTGGGIGSGSGLHNHQHHHSHHPLFGLSLSQGGFGMGAMENGSSMTLGTPSSMSYNRGNTLGPSSLLLQRRSISFGVEDDDDDDDDDEDTLRRLTNTNQNSSINNNVRFGLRYIPAGTSEPSQIRMPWERPGYLTSQSLAELLSDDIEDEGNGNNNNMNNNDSSNSLGAFNASSLRRGFSSSGSSTLFSSSPSVTYQIVPRNGGQGGYETVAMPSTSLPATQLSSILLGRSSSTSGNNGVFSTNATEGSASGDEDT